MASRDEQFKKHPLWQTLTALDESLDFTPDSADLEAVESLRSLSVHVRRVLSQTDPNLVPLANLDSLNAQLNNASTQMAAFKGNSSPPHLTNAIKCIDPALVALAPAWTARTPDDVGNIRDDVGSFRKSASQLVNGLRSEFDEANRELQSLREARDELRDEIDEQRGRLDAAINEHQSQFSVAQDARSTEHDTARSERQTAFTEQTAALKEQADKVLAGISKIATEAHASEREEHEGHVEKANTTLAQLEELREKAAKVVGVVGNIGMTGDYQKIANAEKEDAKKWSDRAIVLLLLALVLAAAVLMFRTDGVGAAGTARRIALSVAAFTPATYCTAQAREHRRVENRNRSMELELASLDPFMAQLPEEYQQAMKAELATRYFHGSNSDVGELDVDGRLERLRRVRKADTADETSEDQE